MKKPVFTGAAVAIITPMNADGSVNFEELGRIIDDQIAHGTDAIVICGTTGESPTLSDEEHTCLLYTSPGSGSPQPNAWQVAQQKQTGAAQGHIRQPARRVCWGLRHSRRWLARPEHPGTDSGSRR